VRRQKRSEEWTKDGGHFITDPVRWLRDRRWEDEPIEISEPKIKYFDPPNAFPSFAEELRATFIECHGDNPKAARIIANLPHE